ncbi:hypothetical protein D6C84_01946 [Aureobasidium pullulans]|uniref:Uncharacterized protein n=1 Tax=Aureobasidium pullulans TaxID=5580 RepID=A0A4S9Y891_AURPU|nr:hypothetical protein D6C84_01946 [Aureobasidium pullulans]
MSTTTIATPEPIWVFEKAVLVHAPEFDVACTARLRMAHDHNTDQGSVSIRIQLELANFGKQLLMLNIRPELVDTCTVVPKSNDNLIPSRLFPLVPVSVTNSAAVSTLILCLNSTGVVLVPRSTNDTTLSAAKPTDAAFHAFQRICRSNIIHLHFSKQQLKNDDIRQLRTFSGALRAGLLSAQPFDYKRLDAGRGAIEKDWRVFEASEDPPAYAASVKSVLGKRTRDGSPPEEPSLPAPCSPAPPPWSPTEVNTPTTRSCSPAHISPTHFIEPTQSRKERLKVLGLQQQLHGLPDSLVRQILVGSGHNHLLVLATEAGLEKLSKGTKLFNNSESPPRGLTDESEDTIAITRIDKIIEQRLAQLTKDAFKRLTRTHLNTLVESQLPVAADLFLNGAVADYRDQFYEECQLNENSVRENIDEGLTEIRDVTNDCTKEVQELAQQCMDSLDEHSKRLDASAEHELSKLKRWFAELAGSFLDKEVPKSSPTRRVSM